MVQSLKANNGAQYSDLKEKADKKNLTIYPVMFGRAKAMLGLVKSAKRGEGKKAKAGGVRGRPQDDSSKSGQIRSLLSSGMTTAEIAKKVGCSVNLVYAVKAGSKRGPGRPAGSGSGKSPTAKRGPGRPPKSAALAGSIDSVIQALRDGDRDRDRLRRALDQIRAILDGLG